MVAAVQLPWGTALLILPTVWAVRFIQDTAGEVGSLPLIPYPAHVELPPITESAGHFEVKPTTRLGLGQGIVKEDLAVTSLQRHLGGNFGLADSHDGGDIQLSLTNGASSSPEGYSLHVDAQTVTLEAPALAGLFYGVQTLMQLASKEGGTISVPSVTIKDAPRFQWRGLHLDVSRHFFPAQQVMKFLDTMSTYKLNKFHWHLTDDQGWRLPVDGYPRLTEIGSDGFGGRQAYTEQDIKDVVAYATDRHIEVIPEVDVPGHAAAAIAAYPELGNSDVPNWRAPSGPWHSWGVTDYTLGPKPDTWHFLGKVFDTVARLFPSPLVHMGGDEAKSTEWARSQAALSQLPASQMRGRNRPSEVQTMFNDKVAQILHERGREAVGWDETQHIGGLHEDSIVMAWRSENEASLAARSGKRVINANSEFLYFDRYQGPAETEPKAICCSVRLENVYSYDPMPKGLSEKEQNNVMGAQGQLWAEYLPTWQQVEYMAFPRALALAEKTWTPTSSIQHLGFENFKKRLSSRLPDLDAKGVNYKHLSDQSGR